MSMQTETRVDLLLVTIIGCAALLAVALLAVATVLIASRHSLVAWQKLKSAMAVLVWVLPATAIVVALGYMLVVPRQDIIDIVVPATHATASHETHAILARQGRVDQVPDQAAVTSHEADVAFESEMAKVRAADPHSAPSRGTDEPHAIVSNSAPPSNVPDRLRVRKMSSADPQWSTPSNIVKGRELIPLSSKRFATLAEAEADVTQMALARVHQQFRDDSSLGASGAGQHELFVRFPGSAEVWRLAHPQALVDLINRFAVNDLVGEVLDWDFGNGTKGKMYRAHLRLDLSAPFYNAVQVAAKEDLARHRLTIFGGLLGLVTLMLGTAAGYFKLDEATGGNYRRRLKLAAAALIAAGGLATAQVFGS